MRAAVSYWLLAFSLLCAARPHLSRFHRRLSAFIGGQYENLQGTKEAAVRQPTPLRSLPPQRSRVLTFFPSQRLCVSAVKTSLVNP